MLHSTTLIHSANSCSSIWQTYVFAYPRSMHDIHKTTQFSSQAGLQRPKNKRSIHGTVRPLDKLPKS